MALQTADPPVAPGAQVVANAFVEQYYHILHHSPELVYRFYQDSSVLSRQEENGEMTSVTTMQGINAKILSLDYTNYKAEIKTADAQESYKDGVIVLVTGCLTGKDNLRKKFAQSFFLAPQAKGYFVLNDVFRYVDESEPLHPKVIINEKVNDSAAARSAVDDETCHAPDAAAPDVATSPAIDQLYVEKPAQTWEKERLVSTEEENASVSQSTENNISVAESSQMFPQEDGVKNSYASIVKKAESGTGRTKVYVPSYAVRSTSISTHKQSSGPMAPALDAELAVNSRKAPENLIAQEVEGHSIHVRNLPVSVTDSQLEEEFEKYGQIKPGGVQVRSNKQQGSCYGFVEFLSAGSMESAIQASPLSIGGRKAFVEIKRTTTRVDGGRGRYPSGRGGFRGGFRSDSFKGLGSHVGGRGFSSDDIGDRGEYFGRVRGRGGRGGEGYQRGRGRVGRGTNRISIGRHAS